MNVVIPRSSRVRCSATCSARRPDPLKARAAARRIVVTDVPVIVDEGAPVGVDARPLIPERTVALVFVSAVHDATIRAVNYARPSRRRRRARSTSTWTRRPPTGCRRSGPSGSDPARHRRGAVPRPDPADARGGPAVHLAPRDARDRRAARVRRLEVVAPAPAQPERAVREALFLFEPNVVLSSVPFVVSSDRRKWRGSADGSRGRRRLCRRSA